jgi:flagellar hook-length control protein FliK
LGKGLEATGVEKRTLVLEATPESQSASSVLQARTRPRAESKPESPMSAPPAATPNVQIATPAAQLPNSSLAVFFDPVKLTPNGQVEAQENPNQVKNSQEGRPSVTAASSNSGSDGTPVLLISHAPQVSNQQTGSSAPDTKQVDASADKKGGEAVQNSTTVTNDKGPVPKAGAESPLAPHPIAQASAEAGRASPQAAAASPSRGQAGSTSISEGQPAETQKLVSSARFTQQAGNAEMQVKLRSETLGPIDVHTTIRGSEIGASIRVEGRETQVMLTSELSQLQQALNERSLRVEHLDVLQSSVSGGRSNGNGAGNSYGNLSEPRQGFSSYSASHPFTPLPETPGASEDGALGLMSTRINLRV